MNKVIVFGNMFYNTIGLVHSLGEAGHSVDLLVVSKCREKCSYRLSKYVRKFMTAPTEEDGVALLVKEYAAEIEKPTILFAGDPPVCAVDRHYEELKGTFRFFNCGEQGRINFFMDKVNTFKVAKECGIGLIKTWIVKDISSLPTDLNYPILTKGANSITSNKGHMNVFYDEDSLKGSLCSGVEYLLQEYLEKEYELNLVGLSVNHGEKILLPAVIRKIRDDLHRQSVYIRLDDINDYPDLDVESVRKFVLALKYEGIFSVELLKSSGKYHFLEVNLRNDGCGYLYTAAGINYPALWVKYCRGELRDSDFSNVKFKTPFYLMHWDDVYNMVEGKVGIFRWLHQAFAADAHFVMNAKDGKPFLCEFRRSLWPTFKRCVKKGLIRYGVLSEG